MSCAVEEMEGARSVRTRLDAGPEPKPTGSGKAPRKDMLDTMVEAVKEHRLSMLQRPKSAGTDRKDKHAQPLRLLDQEAKRGRDLQKYVRTIEYSTGLETFLFPTPVPRLPPRSATLTASRSTDRVSRIGLAIGSPTQVPPNWYNSQTCAYVSPQLQTPVRWLPTPPSSTGAERGENVTPTERSRNIRWKAFTKLFRRDTRSKRRARGTETPQGMEQIEATLSPPQKITSSPDIKSPHLSARTTPSMKPPVEPPIFRHTSTMPTSVKAQVESHAIAKTEDVNHDLVSPNDAESLETDGWPHVAPLRIRKGTTVDTKFCQQNSHASSPERPNTACTEPRRPPEFDLALPEVELDRHNNMFAEVLRRKSEPSLMERRSQRVKPLKLNKGDPNISRISTASVVRLNPLSKKGVHPVLKALPPRPQTAHDDKQQTKQHGSADSSSISAPPNPNQLKQSIIDMSSSGDSSKRASTLRIHQAFLVTESSPLSLDSSCPVTPVTAGSPRIRLSCSEEIDSCYDHSLPIMLGESLQRRRMQRARQSVQSDPSLEYAVADKQPLKPRVVDLSQNRKSTIVYVESGVTSPFEGQGKIGEGRSCC